MNLPTVFAIAAAAFVGSAAAYSTDACSASQQATAYTAMVPLISGTDLTSCSTTSGYNMLYATSLPTNDQKAIMCKTDSCKSLISTIISYKVPDCVLTVPTSGAKLNVYALADSFASDCAALNPAETPAPTTATPSTTTATPSTTTATPSTTTATPSTTTATPSTPSTSSPAAC